MDRSIFNSIDGQDNLDKELTEIDRKPHHNKFKKRANELDGKSWIQYSISIWSDIRKSREEIDLGHPAIFPVALVNRLINCLTNNYDRLIFDPFAGVGSTILTAKMLGKDGIGLELNPKFADIARKRLSQTISFEVDSKTSIHVSNAIKLLEYVKEGSVDLVITSPPYWDILTEKRTADSKEIRHYGNEKADLGRIKDYRQFLRKLKEIFAEVYKSMREAAYCCVIVMDIRKKDKFYPFHSDVAAFMQEIGFIYDDIIIWDRRHEYNNLRALGYPTVFRVNKVHEFILIFKKPTVIDKKP